jgi:photosystem II stability/assembly factor-like uncharacterized protein
MSATGLLIYLLTLGIPSEPSMWTVQTSGVDTNLRGISAVEGAAMHGRLVPMIWVCGSNGVIMKSGDAGHSWKRLHVEGGDALDFRGIRAFDERTAYVMSAGEGENSRIYKTSDGGVTWSLQYTDKRPAFFLDAIACVYEKQCFAVSDPVDGKFLLITTQDGEHWKELPGDGMPAALRGEGAFAASSTTLAILGPSDLYIGSGGPAARVFHSANSGSTWSVATTPILSGEASQGIFSVFREVNTVLVVGGDYKNLKRADKAAAYSTDAGATWKLADGQPSGFRSAVASLGEGMLAAVGPSGEDVSTDGGVHWAHTDSLNLNAISVLHTGDAWAAGPNGTVARFTYHKK